MRHSGGKRCVQAEYKWGNALEESTLCVFLQPGLNGFTVWELQERKCLWDAQDFPYKSAGTVAADIKKQGKKLGWNVHGGPVKENGFSSQEVIFHIHSSATSKSLALSHNRTVGMQGQILFLSMF